MTLLKDFAASLDEAKIGDVLSVHDIAYANEHGIVIVFGSSDDRMEFCGAMDMEVSCFEGTTVYFDKGKMVMDSIDPTLKYVNAVWDEECPWSYDTNISHETFDVLEDGELYCRGIVFMLDDVKDVA